ncbi:MAG: hypothetical protein U5K28_10865 [Halobacteriales archaeon]|nr:hypothetical protein [Halobacteriales archaeon]
MPSRRTLLAGVATAGATVLAGCSSSSLPRVRQGSPLGHPQTLQSLRPPSGFATPTTRTVPSELSAAAHEYRIGGDYRLDLVTEYRLIPGENQHANNGWRLAELDATHDYGHAAPAVGARTNFVPVADAGTAVGRTGRCNGPRLGDGVFRHRWTLRFGDTGDATWVRRLLTELATGHGVPRGRPSRLRQLAKPRNEATEPCRAHD